MGDPSAFTGATAVELAMAFRSGLVKPSELTEYLLARIEADRDKNVFITVTGERAMREARAADERYARGMPLSLLDGVSVTWKDLFDMAGTVTTAGSALLARGALAASDAEAVSHLAAAGMVSLGKANTAEFAYSGLGLNPHFGTPRNPRDPATARSPGGSSSGSAAAVASGLSCCAIGTDTGGSVRVPASFNGVVGLKTSVGRIGKGGMFTLSATLDTVGPFARSVEDCALLFQYLQGNVAPRIARGTLSDLTVVAPRNLVCDDLERAVAENFEASLTLLQAHGARIRRENVPALDRMRDILARHGTLVAAEAYTEHAGLVDGPEVDRIDRRVTSRILAGRDMSARDVLIVLRESARLGRDLAAQLDGALLVMPTTPTTAPAVAPLEADDELFRRTNLHTLRNVSLGNALNLCGLAIPNGQDAGRLPTSLLLMATHDRDETLLAFGLEVERALQSLAGETPGAPACPDRIS